MSNYQENISSFQFSGVIDWQRMHKISMGETPYQLKLLQMFVENAETYLAEIGSAIANNDCETVVNVSHKLKGVSSHLGVRYIPDVALQLENRGMNSQLDKTESLLVVLEQLLAEIRALLAELHSKA